MIQPVILAAGKGTRLQSSLPKTLYPVAGKPIIRHVLSTLKEVPGLLPPLIVVGHQSTLVREALGTSYGYVEQKELTGTAHAVRAALPALDTQATGMLILYGDQPFITSHTLERMTHAFNVEKPAIMQSVLSVSDFEGRYKVFRHYGRFKRDGKGRIQEIIEYKNASPEEMKLCEVNPGTCCVEVSWAASALPQVSASGSGEYYVTALVGLAYQQQKKIITMSMAAREAIGINSQEDAQEAELFL